MVANSDDTFTIAADEAVFLPFFLMETIPEGATRIYLLLGDRMAFTDVFPGVEEMVKEAIRETKPQGKLAYIIIKSIGSELYEYESGVASVDGLTPHVKARVYLVYTRGETMA
jgi:hypothetical protein